MATTLGPITLLDGVVVRLGADAPSGKIGLLIHPALDRLDLGCRGHLTPGLSNVVERAMALWRRGKLANYPFCA